MNRSQVSDKDNSNSNLVRIAPRPPELTPSSSSAKLLSTPSLQQQHQRTSQNGIRASQSRPQLLIQGQARSAPYGKMAALRAHHITTPYSPLRRRSSESSTQSVPSMASSTSVSSGASYGRNMPSRGYANQPNYPKDPVMYPQYQGYANHIHEGRHFSRPSTVEETNYLGPYGHTYLRKHASGYRERYGPNPIVDKYAYQYGHTYPQVRPPRRYVDDVPEYPPYHAYPANDMNNPHYTSDHINRVNDHYGRRPSYGEYGPGEHRAQMVRSAPPSAPPSHVIPNRASRIDTRPSCACVGCSTPPRSG